jgi:hypothetical protein
MTSGTRQRQATGAISRAKLIETFEERRIYRVHRAAKTKSVYRRVKP